VADEIDMMKW